MVPCPCYKLLTAASAFQQYEIVILGGLAGRLDQTIHTLSYLHKLRKVRDRVYAVTDDNVGWVLDSVRPVFRGKLASHCFIQGEHHIEIDHSVLGVTCGLLPVGIDSTVLSTCGLKWDLSELRIYPLILALMELSRICFVF